MAIQHRGDIEARRMRVARLLVERHSIRDIARIVGISKSQAQRDMAAVRAEWMAERVASADQVVADELARLAAAESSIWPLVRFGDLGAIDRLLRIMERRAKLLGLDAPTKIDITEEIRRAAQEAGLSAEDTEAAVREAAAVIREAQAR